MPWLTQQVRVTAFFPTRLPQQPTVPSWQQLTGAEPEQTLRRAGTLVEVGPQPIGRLQIARQLPLRADFLYAPSMVREEGDIANLGPPRDAVAATTEVARRFVTSTSPIVRLAVGMQALFPTDSLESGRRELTRLLPLHQLDLEGVTDFLIQVNRPQASQVLNGTPINRIGKWTRAEITVTTMDETGRAARAPAVIGVHVETDISTDAERDEVLPSDQVSRLLDEFFAKSLEIIEAGDRR